MKIKRLYEKDEKYSLHSVEEGLEDYEWYFESILDYFFRDFDLAGSELSSSTKGEYAFNISLIVDVFTLDLDSKYLMKFAEFLKFIEPYCEYKFYPKESSTENSNDAAIGIQADFKIYVLKKMEKNILKTMGYKYHPQIKKYNI